MSSSWQPSPARFVIHTPKRGGLPRHLAETTRIQPVEGSDLTVLEFREIGDEDAASNWKALVDKIALEFAVDPVLVDADGVEHYPTGDLMVRFSEPPSGDELSRFAERFALLIVERNKWVPAQVRFERVESDRFLPELVLALEKADGVRAAWATTLTRYERADPRPPSR